MQLTNRQLTEAERGDPLRFESGDVVQFVQNAPGHKRGERLVVIEDAPEVRLDHPNSVGLVAVRGELGEARLGVDRLPFRAWCRASSIRPSCA